MVRLTKTERLASGLSHVRASVRYMDGLWWVRWPREKDETGRDYEWHWFDTGEEAMASVRSVLGGMQ